MKCYLFCSHLASRSLQDVQLSKHLCMKSLPPPRGTCWRAHYLERKKPNTRWRLSSSAVPQPLPMLITSCHGRVIFSYRYKCLSALSCSLQARHKMNLSAGSVGPFLSRWRRHSTSTVISWPQFCRRSKFSGGSSGTFSDWRTSTWTTAVSFDCKLFANVQLNHWVLVVHLKPIVVAGFWSRS